MPIAWWQDYVKAVAFFSDYIGPPDPRLYWIALLILGARTTSPYAAYVYGGYIWTDIAIATVLQPLVYHVFGSALQYCVSAHILGSLLACVFADVFLVQTLSPPMPLYGWFVLGYLTIISLSIQAAAPGPDIPVMYYGACNVSIWGMFLGLLVGATVGLLRMSFYVDLTRLSRLLPQRTRLPTSSVRSDPPAVCLWCNEIERQKRS